MLLYVAPKPKTGYGVNACGWAWTTRPYSTNANHNLAYDRSTMIGGDNVLEDLPNLTPETQCECWDVPGCDYKAWRRSAHTHAAGDGAFTSCGIGLTCGPQDPNLNGNAKYAATSSNVVWFDPLREGEYRLMRGRGTSANSDEAWLQYTDTPGIRFDYEVTASGSKALRKLTGSKLTARQTVITNRYYAFHLANGVLCFGYASNEALARSNITSAAESGGTVLPSNTASSTWSVTTDTFANGLVYLNVCFDDYAEGMLPIPW